MQGRKKRTEQIREPDRGQESKRGLEGSEDRLREQSSKFLSSIDHRFRNRTWHSLYLSYTFKLHFSHFYHHFRTEAVGSDFDGDGCSLFISRSDCKEQDGMV